MSVYYFYNNFLVLAVVRREKKRLAKMMRMGMQMQIMELMRTTVLMRIMARVVITVLIGKTIPMGDREKRRRKAQSQVMTVKMKSQTELVVQLLIQ